MTDIERTDSGVGSEASADSTGSNNEKMRRRSKDIARAAYLQNMLDAGGGEGGGGVAQNGGHRCDDCEQWVENERWV